MDWGALGELGGGSGELSWIWGLRRSLWGYEGI